MRYRKISILVLCVLTVMAALYGCGSSSKEGTLSGTSPNSVGDTMCRQCHSAVMDPLTGEGIIAQYDNTSPHRNSPYANNGNGCEACHGGGAQHNGVGPIPYPNPFDGNGTRCVACHTGKYQTNAPTKFATSLHGQMTIETGGSCRRCHTHEGAVLGAMSGLTGSLGVMDNAAYQNAVPPQKEFGVFQCGTCHAHGGGLRTVKGRDTSGNVVNWNPSKTFKANDQFNLCTGCHTMKSYDGNKVLASGNIVTYGSFTVATDKVGHHETSWYRVLATTHLNNSDNVAAGGISGYVVRIPKTADDAYASTTNPDAKPCFDCHGHEWRVNTQYVNPAAGGTSTPYDASKVTIWTEWAESGHAGQILRVKMAAVGASTRNAAAVDTAMTTTVNDTTAAAWNHYDWSGTNRQTCQRCHTATGASNYLNGPSTYNRTKNDFQHLNGWTVSKPTSSQRELLYCWGCHANVEADKGGLRNPGAMTADYNFKGAKAQFPDVESSNVCIACHQGQASGETITSIATTSTNSISFVNSHYMAVGGMMYNKIGFIAFTDPTTTTGNTSAPTYGGSLTSTADGGNISSTHRSLGSTSIIGQDGITASDTQYTSGGPCMTCHMTKIGDKRHHTWEIDDSAISNVCLKCHSAELSTALTTTNFQTAFLDPQEEVFQDALSLALDLLVSNYSITFNQAAYPYFFENGAPATAVVDWTRATAAGGVPPSGTLSGPDAIKLMGAAFNVNLLKREPAAFAHARTYTRRLIYDSIDFLDDKTINMSSGTSAQASSRGLWTKATGSWSAYAFTGDVEAPGTTLAPGVSESMTYLLRYSRSTGKWSLPERP